jgi:uncharacterized membrane protein (UPF0127 family)
MYINVYIKNYIFKTKVLSSPKDIELGMMGKKFTNKFDALLFIMNKPSSAFWMKNCIIPLDIIFIQNNIITKIHNSCPPCNQTKDKCKEYKGKGNLVIEMPGGTCKQLNIKKGDIIFAK